MKILWPVLRTMIDARDLNGILLDLVNDNVGRKNQFAPSGSCVQGGRGGEIGATIRNRHRWLSRHPERRRDCLSRCVEICAPGLLREC